MKILSEKAADLLEFIDESQQQSLKEIQEEIVTIVKLINNFLNDKEIDVGRRKLAVTIYLASLLKDFHQPEKLVKEKKALDIIMKEFTNDFLCFKTMDKLKEKLKDVNLN